MTNNKCIGLSNPNSLNYNYGQIIYQPCDNNEYQRWVLNESTGQMALSISNVCLAAKSNALGSTLTVKPCNTDNTQWLVLDDDLLKLNDIRNSLKTSQDLCMSGQYIPNLQPCTRLNSNKIGLL
jgi:hypothetical protein